MTILVLLLIGFLAVVDVNGNASCHYNSTASTLNQLASLLQELAANSHDNHCDNHTQVSTGSCNMIERKIDDLKTTLEEKIDRLTHTCKVNKLSFADSTIGNSKYDPSPLLHSCEEIKTYWPNATSDYYLIADINGQPRHVYCHMERLCNDDEGWMRVAYLNMTDVTEDCPPGFNLYTSNGIRACGRPSSSSGSCQSVKFPSYSVSYTQVCGRVIGYQYGSPDAFGWRSPSTSIDAAYIDGVSLTYGSPRKHIWTFIAGLQENTHAAPDERLHECPCAPTTKSTLPSFIGNDYFCESGCPGHWQYHVFYPDPLWDGQQCGVLDKPCCGVSGLPWFHKTLKGPTTDYIEMRICADQATNDEDVPVSYYELYIK